MPNISISWLRDHVDVPAGTTTEELAADLVRVGIEEEQIIPAAVTGPLVAGIVRSYVVEKHSNGKAIRYCRVDVGQYNDPVGEGPEPSDIPSRGIVCGAHNFEVGDTVAVVLPGAVLPGPFLISARKTYGHVSDGMICSARELGLGEDHDGIIVLNDDPTFKDLPVPGTDMIPLLGLGEEVLEVNVTPDRGYCFAVRGLAREYAHSTGSSFRDLGLPSALSSPLPSSTDGAFKADVDPESAREGRAACDRFVTRIVRGIDPTAPTPKWMVQRLEQAGMRSLSLAVDVTNYVMLDLGQPLHAYDLNFVQAPFVVRRANEGERFVTLDGSELALDQDDVLITDSPQYSRASRIVGLAGVMGGLDSEVTEETTDVVIEAAHFDPVSIARAARRHRLHSEASKRFERGVDPQLPPVAAARAAELIAKYGHGTVEESGWDYMEVPALVPVKMSAHEPARLAGLDLSVDQISQLLEMIGCTVGVVGENLLVTPPSWRPDLVGPAHLVEEIARLYGYDRIPTRVPSAPGSAGLTARQVLRRRVAQTLSESGLVEVKSYPFISNAHDRQLITADDKRRKTVILQNPLADDAPGLRTTLLDTLLETAERNAARGVAPLALFEVGQVALPDGCVPTSIPGVEGRPTDEELTALTAGVPAQPWKVAGVMGGEYAPVSGLELEEGTPAANEWTWSDAIESVRDLTLSNGVKVEATRRWMSTETERKPGPPLPELAKSPEETAPWHPSRCATLFVRRGRGLVVIGHAGELHPQVVEEYGLPARSVAFEVDLSLVEELVPDTFLKVRPISVFPPAKEDFAIVVDDSVPESDVESTIRRAAGSLLETLTLFDVYRGPQVPEGKRSVAYGLTLRAPASTLTADEVAAVRKSVVDALQKRLNAELRG